MTVGLLIECLVAVLLVTTIGYCILLNRQLVRLRNDEQALKGTIAELVTATEIAERAIAGLKVTAAEAERTLATRLKEGDLLARSLGREVSAGESVLKRIVQITECARSGGLVTERSRDPAPEPARDRVPFHRARGVAA
jgi:hypothetical protein